MADRLEDRIRDYLATHLEMLGDGLSLLHKEHVLPYPAGAGGRIDILARDKFGVFVVIEIKRSNRSARDTLNEIHRYTALLRIQQGLGEAQVRLAIVSTDWGELRLPLSECAEAFPYAIDPIAITAMADGTITGLDRVTLLPKTGIIRLSRVQGAYCFRDGKARDAALPDLLSAATSAALADFVVLKLDYAGKSAVVCFPFSLYLLFSSPLLNATRTESEAIKAQVGWDDGLDQPEEIFLGEVMRSFVGHSDDFEIGYPEKLTTILTAWKVTEISRHGRLAADHSLLTDADVLCLAQAAEGGSPIYLYKLCSPKLSASWKQLGLDLTSTLRGMPEWEEVVPAFLKEVESDAPDASVSIDVYNPCDLLMSLYPVAWAGDFSGCPRLEIVVEDSTNKRVRLLSSLLAWNGKQIRETPRQIVNRVYGSDVEWTAAMHFHETHTREVKMLAAHGLTAPIVEFTRAENGAATVSRLEMSGSGLSRNRFDLDTLTDMVEFSTANKNYLSALKEFLESVCIGLPGSELMRIHRVPGE